MISMEEFFDGKPAVSASAPGRVSLLGEHTEYDDGLMLPTATPQLTEVAFAPASDHHFELYSATLDQRVRFGRGDAAPPGFARYVEGCVRMLEERALTVPALHGYIRSDVPPGAGLASGAALEVATLRALRSLLGLPLDDVAIALIGQQAEIRYAQVGCGVMDQLAVSLADCGHMLFLDARALSFELLPMPPGAALIVIDSGIKPGPAVGKFSERRSECEEAARLLGVPALRDVDDPRLVEALPAPLRQRARHVVREYARVLQACSGADAAQFGALMNQSHASLRDDYQVSIPELDELTALLREDPEVFGARLTGAGYGGACVALSRPARAAEAGAIAVQRFNAAASGGRTRRARLLLPRTTH
jgi:galactokinase